MTVTEFPGGVRVEGAEPFDLAQTLDCGQCFRFAPTGDGGWFGAAGGHAAGLRFEGESLVLEGATAAEFEGFWRDYLDLDRDYAAVRAAFARDPRLAPCVAFAPGIRVLRQPAFEALIAFIVSQNNNVPRIKGILARLCALFGEPLPGGARAFPVPERLAACSKEELAPLRSGWRAGYILDAARQVAAGTVDLQAVAVMPLADARRELTRIRGVGPKVAECVLLYGMGRLECFPMDVWMKRAMARLFPEETGKMPESAPAIFGPYAGIAQQYIFHYCRCHPEEIREKTA